MKKQPVYMYRCEGKCKKYIYTEDTFQKCCGRLMSWICGVEEIGMDLKSKITKVKVSGWIELSKENLDRLMTHADPHTSLVYSIHMGYCDASNMTFEPEE